MLFVWSNILQDMVKQDGKLIRISLAPPELTEVLKWC